MPNPRRVNISKTEFSGLEQAMQAIIHDQQLSRPRLAQSFLSIEDDTGKTMPITDIGDAYIALAYLGEVDEIRELERELKVPAKVINHELGMLASVNGYKVVIENLTKAMSLSKEPLVPLEILLRDMQTIEGVTGSKPPQQIHDMVYSIMVQWKSHVDVFQGARDYANKTNSKPSPNIAQGLYEAVCSADKNEFVKRVTALSGLFGVFPYVNGSEASPKDFVDIVMGKEFHVIDKPTTHAQLRHLAMYAKPEFVTWMEEKDRELKQFNNYELTFDNTRLMWAFYRLAAEYKIELPATVFEELPRYLAIPLAYTINFDVGNRSNLTLRDLIRSGLFEPNQEAISSAVEESFKALYEMLLWQMPNRRAKEIDVNPRIENLKRLLVTANASLTPASLGYAEKIREMYRTLK